MKVLNKILFIIILIAVSTNLYAKSAPILPNSYDGSAPSARSVAMGSAGQGLVNSDESFYYNSACLSYNTGTHVQASFAFLERDNAHNNEIYNPAGFGLISVYVVRDTNSFAWQTLSNNVISVINKYGSWNKTSISINSITISSGKKSVTGYSSGLSLSYLYGTVGEYSIDSARNPYSNVSSGNGFACNLSFLFPLSENLSFGLNLKNLIAFMFWEKYSADIIPCTIMSGVGYVYKDCTLSFDWDKHLYRFGSLNEDTFHFGIEQYFNKIIYLRVGAISNSDLNKNNISYTCGFAVNIKNYQFSFGCEENKLSENDYLKCMLSLKSSI